MENMMTIDFDNEDAVLDEVAKALKAKPDELSIEGDQGLGSFGVGRVYRVEWGRQEYVVVEDHDQMRELALEVVKQDLEQEPEIFTQSWLEDFVDKNRLRHELEPDVLNSRIDQLTDDAEYDPDRFWSEYGPEAPEEDEDGERREPTRSEIEELAEKQTEAELRDPMQYLEDIYGDEAAQKAIEIAGIDIDAAAEDAIDTDGAEHFLSRYDGNSYETKSGFVYWREN